MDLNNVMQWKVLILKVSVKGVEGDNIIKHLVFKCVVLENLTMGGPNFSARRLRLFS